MIANHRCIINATLAILVTSFIVLVLAVWEVNHNVSAISNLQDSVHTMKQLDDLYYGYVNEDVESARQYMLRSVSVIEKSSCFDESNRAGLLNLEYSRLAVLEYKVGTKGASEAFILCSQYWELRSLELSGMSPEAAMQKIHEANMQGRIDAVEKMDRRLHGGRLANYNVQRN
jgi:hypothetical protein